MDKKNEVDKEKEEDKGTEVATQDKETGDKPDEVKDPEKPDPRDERLDDLQRKVDRLERGGSSEAGIKPPEKKKETDDEYADRVVKGEANPLAEDGFI